MQALLVYSSYKPPPKTTGVKGMTYIVIYTWSTSAPRSWIIVINYQ